MRSLLLFDIDGTLVDTEGAGLISLREGFFESFPDRKGEEFPPLDLGGATDGSVVAFLFEHFRIEDHDHHRSQFFREYERVLERKLREFQAENKGRVLPGIPALLARLAERREDFVLALLTGNTEEGARIKLRSFGLESYFRLGAFGSDHHDRNELGPIALERAEKELGRAYAPHRAIVIGDTGKDIACARACGARVIAVATGAVSREELAEGRPDGLLSDLEDTESAIAMLESLME